MFKLTQRCSSELICKVLITQVIAKESLPQRKRNCWSAQIECHIEDSVTLLLAVVRRVNEFRLWPVFGIWLLKKSKLPLRFHITKAIGNEYWCFSIWNLVKDWRSMAVRLLQSTPQAWSWRTSSGPSQCSVIHLLMHGHAGCKLTPHYI